MSNLYINRFLPSKFVPVINVHLGKYKICVLPLDNGVKIHILPLDNSVVVDYHRRIFIILKINLFRDYFKQNFIKKLSIFVYGIMTTDLQYIIFAPT